MAYVINPQVPSRFFTPGRRVATDLIVIHTAETRESSDVDEAVADYYRDETTDHASATGAFDDDSYTPMVGPDSVAWHAGKTIINERSEGFEHAGRAAQTGAEWDDPFSHKMLRNSADFTSKRVRALGIPIVKLTPAEVAAGGKGFCGHIDVTNAYGVVGGHWDPGPAFPWGNYLSWVADAYNGVDLFAPAQVPNPTIRTINVNDLQKQEVVMTHNGWGCWTGSATFPSIAAAGRDAEIIAVYQQGPFVPVDGVWLDTRLGHIGAQSRGPGHVEITAISREGSVPAPNAQTLVYVTVA